MTKVLNILGIPVDVVTMDQATDRIASYVDDYKKDGRSRYVATANVDFLVNTWGWTTKSVNNPALLNALRNADLVTADGMPLVWFSKWMGHPLPERVAGSDLLISLSERAAKEGFSIYLLGGAPGDAQVCAETLMRRFPGLTVAGMSSPIIDLSSDPKEDDPILEAIHSSKASILFLGLGNPKQELWFERIRGRLRVPATIGVGGSFRFVAGGVKRAPAWMQKSGMEWIFRFWQEPKRLWKRYCLGILKFCALALPALWQGAATGPNLAARIDVAVAGALLRGRVRAVPASRSQERWFTAHRMADFIDRR